MTSKKSLINRLLSKVIKHSSEVHSEFVADSVFHGIRMLDTKVAARHYKDVQNHKYAEGIIS